MIKVKKTTKIGPDIWFCLIFDPIAKILFLEERLVTRRVPTQF